MNRKLKKENIPQQHFHTLAEVRNRVEEIPTDKPIVVHCAGGYRSAAGKLYHSLKIKWHSYGI